MTELETFVLQTAIDLADAMDAVDAGIPVQDYVRGATTRLRKAVNELHAEHDGRYPL